MSELDSRPPVYTWNRKFNKNIANQLIDPTWTTPVFSVKVYFPSRLMFNVRLQNKMTDKKKTEWSILAFSLGLLSLVFATKSFLMFFWQNGTIAGWIYLGATALSATLGIWATVMARKKK